MPPSGRSIDEQYGVVSLASFTLTVRTHVWDVTKHTSTHVGNPRWCWNPLMSRVTSKRRGRICWAS